METPDAAPSAPSAAAPGGAPLWSPWAWTLWTAVTGWAAVSPEAARFLENFPPNDGNAPALIAAGLTGLFWLLALPFQREAFAGGRGFAGAAADGGRLLAPALAGWGLALALAARTEPFTLTWAGLATAGFAAQLFSAWAVARNAPRLYVPLFSLLTLVLPGGAWLGEQFASMLGAPATLPAAFTRGSFFACLASLHDAAACGTFLALHLILGGGALLGGRRR